MRAAVRSQLAQRVDELGGCPLGRRPPGRSRPDPGGRLVHRDDRVRPAAQRRRGPAPAPRAAGRSPRPAACAATPAIRSALPSARIRSASSSTSRPASSRTHGSSRAVCPRLNAPATSARSRVCDGPSRSSSELRCSRLNAPNSSAGSASTQIRPRSRPRSSCEHAACDTATGYAEQRVGVHRAEPPAARRSPGRGRRGSPGRPGRTGASVGPGGRSQRRATWPASSVGRRRDTVRVTMAKKTRLSRGRRHQPRREPASTLPVRLRETLQGLPRRR